MPLDPLDIFGPPPVVPDATVPPYAAPPSYFDEDTFQQSMLGQSAGEPEPPLPTPLDVPPDDGFDRDVVAPLREQSLLGTPRSPALDAPDAVTGTQVLPEQAAQRIEQQTAPPELYDDTDRAAIDRAGQEAEQAFQYREQRFRDKMEGREPSGTLEEEQAFRSMLSPDERAEYDFNAAHRQRQAVADETRAARLEVQRKEREANETFERARVHARQERERIAADAIRMADEPDINLGQAIAGIILAAASGFVSPTGPNSGVAMINQMVEKNRRGRQTKLDERRRLLGETLEDAQAEWELQRKEAIAGHEMAIQGITDRQAEVDPHGTYFRELEGYKAQHRAAQRAEFERIEDRSIKNGIAIAENEREETKLKMMREKAAAEARAKLIAARNAPARAAAAALERTTKRFDALKKEGLIGDEFSTPEQWAAAGAPVAGGGSTRAVEAATKQAQLIKAQVEASGAIGEQEKELRIRGLPDPAKPGDYLRGPDGQPMLITGSTDATKEVRNSIVSGKAFVHNVDKLINIGENANWNPKVLKSKVSQESEAIMADTVQYYRQLIKLGQMTKDEKEMAEAVVRDPTAIWDYIPSLRQHRQQALERVNTEGAGNVVGWKRIEIPEPTPADAALEDTGDAVEQFRNRGDKLDPPEARLPKRAAAVAEIGKKATHRLRQLKDESPATRIRAYEREISALDQLLAEEVAAARGAGEVDSSGRTLGNEAALELSNLRGKFIQERSKLQDLEERQRPPWERD